MMIMWSVQIIKIYAIKDLVYQWKVDYTDDSSFHNWMSDQNLYCESHFMIGLFGSCLFAGFALLGLFLRLGNIYGRKKVLIFGIILQTILASVLLFSNNYKFYYVILFL